MDQREVARGRDSFHPEPQAEVWKSPEPQAEAWKTGEREKQIRVLANSCSCRIPIIQLWLPREVVACICPEGGT